jgi:repressor LexA
MTAITLKPVAPDKMTRIPGRLIPKCCHYVCLSIPFWGFLTTLVFFVFRSTTMANLTRRQQQIFEYLLNNQANFAYPPTLEELSYELGLASRGSLHKHIAALVRAGLVEPAAGSRYSGIRLTPAALDKKPVQPNKLPLLGRIAAGKPIEAIPTLQFMDVPQQLRSDKPCYVLEVKGDSMVEAGILDGDWVVEQRSCARNGEIVVALINQQEATLKTLEQTAGKIILHPANAALSAQVYPVGQVEIQGVVVAQMRRYR